MSVQELKPEFPPPAGSQDQCVLPPAAEPQSVPPPPQSALAVNTETVGQVQYIDGQGYIVKTESNVQKTWAKYRGRTSIICGCLIVCCAVLGMVVNIAALILLTSDGPYRYLYFSSFLIGYGLWGAVLFIIAGAFAIVAGQKKTTPTIITTMVMCILAVVFSGGGQLVCVGMGVGFAVGDSYYGNKRYYAHSAHVAMHSVMLVLTLTEIVATLITSVCCCNVICNKTQETTTTMIPLMTADQPHNTAVSYSEMPPPYKQAVESETKASSPPVYSL